MMRMHDDGKCQAVDNTCCAIADFERGRLRQMGDHDIMYVAQRHVNQFLSPVLASSTVPREHAVPGDI